jgi:hypothetical protein
MEVVLQTEWTKYARDLQVGREEWCAPPTAASADNRVGPQPAQAGEPLTDGVLMVLIILV